MTISDPNNVAWCQQMFSMLASGGTWAVPRSGLIFQKQGSKLVLIERMPYMPEMSETLTPEQLTEQQDGDAESIRRHFQAAGIEVQI